MLFKYRFNDPFLRIRSCLDLKIEPCEYSQGGPSDTHFGRDLKLEQIIGSLKMGRMNRF